VRIFRNPDHLDPETEALILIGGMIVGWCILMGSFIYLAFWYFH
jgi:hypothetical protein